MKFKVKKEWTTEAGLNAVAILVSPTMPHYCGYVSIDKNHKHYRKTYDNLQNIDIHGGLTFAGDAYWEESNNHWLGFDALHLGDAYAWEEGKELITTDDEKIQVKSAQNILGKYPEPEAEIRDLNYIIEQCESLAKQLQED